MFKSYKPIHTNIEKEPILWYYIYGWNKWIKKQVYIEINNNIPEFTEEDINIEEDYYSNLENGRVRNGDGED